MSRVLLISDKTVKRIVAKLVEKGYVKRIGTNRSGKWVLTSKQNPHK
jgi:predicted HTH transcriptional regulator